MTSSIINRTECKKIGRMASVIVLYTYGKLPANQHDVVFLQVFINPTVQDECDMADVLRWVDG